MHGKLFKQARVKYYYSVYQLALKDSKAVDRVSSHNDITYKTSTMWSNKRLTWCGDLKTQIDISKQLISTNHRNF